MTGSPLIRKHRPTLAHGVVFLAGGLLGIVACYWFVRALLTSVFDE